MFTVVLLINSLTDLIIINVRDLMI